MESQIGVLKFLLILENIMNVHRDFILMNKRKRLVVLFRIFIEFCFSIAIYIVSMSKFLADAINNEFNLMLLYFMALFTLIFMLHGFMIMIFYGPRHGEAFREVMRCLHKGHNFARNDSVYNKSVQYLKLRCNIGATLFVVVRIICIVPSLVVDHDWFSDTGGYAFTSYTLYMFFRVWIECRFALGTLMFSNLVFVLCTLLQHLTTLIKGCDQQTDIESEHLKSYAKAYLEFFECSKKLVLCFGTQIVISLSISAFHFIAIMYRYSHMYLFDEVGFMDTHSTIGQVLLHVVSVVIAARAGQLLQRETTKLKLWLARLSYMASSNPDTAYFRTVRDFQRLVNVKPAAARLSQPSARPLGMYLLPAALSLTVNYIIVILQLRHEV